MKKDNKIKISFGMIVFNGEEFLKQVLDSIYEDAYEIVIVEGADKNGMFAANPDGSSTDNTVCIIRNYPDPENKIKLIRGKWRNKEESTNEYLKHMSGDYVWLVDDDEIYKKEDIDKIKNHLEQNPSITAVSFYLKTFFHGLERIMVPPKNKEDFEVWRIFKFRKGYKFSSHRPPTMIDPTTNKIMNKINPWRAEFTSRKGIFIYHFSYITDKQVEEKVKYYENYRLKETNYGIPRLRGFRRIALLNRLWLWFWHLPFANTYRKKKDHKFNYNYLETVWRPWKYNRKEVEKNYGVIPIPSIFSRTIKYKGDYPEAIRSHKLFKKFIKSKRK